MDEKQFPEILSSPMFKKIFENMNALIENKAVFDRVTEILSEVNLKELLFAQLGVILFMMILRSYLFSKVKSFLAHLITEVWTFAIFISLTVFFVPLYVVGFEYLEIIKILFKIINPSP